MSKLSLTQNTQTNLKSQARLLVTFAVAANLLFALILSLYMIMNDEAAGTDLPAPKTSHQQVEPQTMPLGNTLTLVPSPEKW